MHFLQHLAAFVAAAATLAGANSITFINQDPTQRTIVFTASVGFPNIDSVVIPGNKDAKVTFPQGWVGNAYSVSKGAPNVPGMLAEVTFQGWAGLTYYDVSAINNASDTNGIKQLYPASEKNATTKKLVSGCEDFPCPTVYYHPNDVQTVASPETDFICTLGTPPSKKATRDVEIQRVARKFALGRF